MGCMELEGDKEDEGQGEQESVPHFITSQQASSRVFLGEFEDPWSFTLF